MFFLFLLFFLVKSILFASSIFENEPKCIFNSVNIFTGQYVNELDIEAKAKNSIKLDLSYINLLYQDSRLRDEKNIEEYILAGWHYHMPTKAYLFANRIEIIDDDGLVIAFENLDIKEAKKNFFENKKDRKKREEEEKNQESIIRNINFLYSKPLPNYFVQNNRRPLNFKKIKAYLQGMNTLVVEFPNKKTKIYKRQNSLEDVFLLKKEIARTFVVNYEHDEFLNLKEIKKQNIQENKTYSWIKFSYLHPDINYKEKYKDKKDFNITTSDGKSYFFQHANYFPVINKKERSTHPFYILENINTNQVSQHFNYHLDNKKTSPLISQKFLPNGLCQHITYYLLGDKNYDVGVYISDMTDMRFQRVACLKYPYNNQIETRYKFYYEPGRLNESKGSTTVQDKNLNQTKYYYDEHFNIEKIENFTHQNGKNILSSTLIYTWKNDPFFNINFLMSKSFLDSNNEIIYAKTYEYDEEGNKTRETIHGNITKENNNKIYLDSKNYPVIADVDSFSSYYVYSQDGQNVLIEKSDDGGLKEKYSYLPNTNLITAKYICDKDKIKTRYFYEYTNDFSLTQEIEDDGVSLDKDDLSSVSYRMIKNIKLENDTDLPKVIEYKYLDLQKGLVKLYKKEILFHSETGKVIKKDVYSSKNELLYSLAFEYDQKGNLIKQTDPLKREELFTYDQNNNLASHKFLDSDKIDKYYYNSLNQKIKKEEIADNKVYSTNYFYNADHNLISVIDPLNYETTYAYDNSYNMSEESQEFLAGLNAKKTITKKYVSDELSRKIEITDPKGCKSSITYNIFNKPLIIKYSDNTEERFFYNFDNTLQKHIDRKNITTIYSYDYLKRVTSINKYSNDKRVFHSSYKYNSFDVVEEIDHFNNQHIYQYDDLKRLKSKQTISSHSSNVIDYFYNDLNQCYLKKCSDLLEYEHKDLIGRVIEENKQDINGNIFFKKSYIYEGLNVLKTISYINGQESIETKYFDDFKRIKKIIDPIGYETKYQYDDFFDFNGYLTKKTTIVNPIDQKEINIQNSLNKSVQEMKLNAEEQNVYAENRFYDENLNLIKKEITEFETEVVNKKIYEYQFNDMNQLVFFNNMTDNKQTIFQYKNGNISKKINPDNTYINYEYDSFSNLISTKSSDNKINYFFEYNDLNQLEKIYDLNTSQTNTRKYTSTNKLIEEKLFNGLTIQYEYDSQNRKIKINYPDSSKVEYEYEPFYLSVIKRKDSLGNILYTHKFLEYDLSGNLLKEELMGNLGISYYEKDLLNRNKSMDSPFGFQKVEKYNPIGNIEKINWKIFWGSDDTSYFYNDKNQIEKETGLFEDYQNDTVYVEYNDDNKIISKKTTDGQFFYFYDVLNRLIRIEKAQEYVIFYTYDAFNRKMSQEVHKYENGKHKKISCLNFLYDHDLEIGSFNEEDKAVEMQIVNDHKAVAFELNNEIFAPLYDITGNIGSLMSLHYGLVESYRYSASGNTLVFSPSGRVRKNSFFLNPWRFLSKRYDLYSQMYEFNGSYYDPKIQYWYLPDEILRNIPVTQIEIEQDFLKKSNEIQNLNFKAMNNKEVEISKGVFEKMKENNIMLFQVLNVIENPKDIIEKSNGIYQIIGKGFSFEMDMNVKKIISIELL